MNNTSKLALAVILTGLLAAGILFAQSPPMVEPGKAWAVLIGVSNYASEDVQPLRYAASDALSMADFLMSPRGGSFRPDRVQLLLEGDASAEAVRTTLGFLGEKVQDGDSVYIFIAGHGALTPRGLGYFIPADGTLSNVYATGVNFRELKELVEENLAQTKVRILMTDVCHAGRIGAEVSQPTDATPNRVNEYLSQIAPKAGTFLNLLASRPDESSFESEKLGQGVFTYTVLEALNGKAAGPGSLFADTKSVVEFVKVEVPKLTGNLQNPVSNSNFDPAFPLALLDRPGPMRMPVVQTTLVIRNTNRAMFERVEWFDPRYRARGIRKLPKDTEAVQIGGLPAGDVEFKFADQQNQLRSLKLTLLPGQNTLDILSANLSRYRFEPAGPAQVAALRPVVSVRGVPVPASPAQLAGLGGSGEAVLLLKPVAGTSVLVDDTPFGTTNRADEYVQLTGLLPGIHRLTLLPSPDREQRFRLRLFAGSQVFDPESAELRYLREPRPDPAGITIPPTLPANLVNAYRSFYLALWEERLIEPQGNSAWDFYTQMRDVAPVPLRNEMTERLIIAMGDRAQQTILKYLRGGDLRWNANIFEDGATLAGRMQPFFQLKPAFQRDLQSRQSFFTGRALIERGRYPEAVQELQRSINLFPEASHAFNAIGLAYWKQNLLDQAIPPLQQAITLTPNWTYPRNILALVLLELRRYNEAEQAFQASLQINAEDSSSHHGLAQLHLLLGRVADAEGDVRRAIEFNPGNAYAHETYGRLEQRRGNLQEAERLYRLAIRLEPDEPSFRISLAELLRQRGQIAEAQQIFAQVARTNATDLRVVRAYTGFLTSQNRPSEARAVFEQAIKALPKDANLRVMYGAFLRTQRRDGDTETQLKEAIKAAPSNVYAHHDLGSLYLSQGKLPQAERELAEAIKADPRFPHSRMMLGQIRFAQKSYADAIATYSEALALSVEPDQQQELRKLMGDARSAASSAAIQSAQSDLQRNRLRNAWATYAATLKIAPEDPTLIQALLKFESEFTRDADVSILPVSSVAAALETSFWAKLREAEAFWKGGNQEQATRGFAAALAGLTAEDRRKITATGFNIRNDDYSIHQIVYRWASRMLERRDFDGALQLMNSAVSHKIFDFVPGLSPTTVDSLMMPADVLEPKTFSDYEVARHPDRRAHEIFAVVYAAQGNAAKSEEFLRALITREQTEVRSAIQRLTR